MQPLIRPVGIGDLKVVKQRLAFYEAGEVAHVENIMAREKNEREHRRLRQTEEILEQETERTEEDVRDLQSTERFEVQSETQKTLRQEMAFGTGLDVTAGYGPVAVSAYARFDMSNSKEESDRNSNKYAKDIVAKSVARLQERARELRRSRTLEEVEEKASHGFDNTSSGSHAVGIYRWVNKVYRAKVVDYGRRLFYEFIVPEPAAYYLYSLAYAEEARSMPEKPEPPMIEPSSPANWTLLTGRLSGGGSGRLNPTGTNFTPSPMPGLMLGVLGGPSEARPLTPSDITRENYLTFVQRYRAQDVAPPPPRWATASKAFSRETQSGAFIGFASEELKIPKGYVARNGYYQLSTRGMKGDSNSLTVLIGPIRIYRATDADDVMPALVLHGESGNVPVSMAGYDMYALALNVTVWCESTAEALQQWQLATFKAVMLAYEKAMTDYNEAVAAAEVAQGVAVRGRNPDLNRAVERRELKRACVELLMGQHLSIASGIDEDDDATFPANAPQLALNSIVGNAADISFFENAFEWNALNFELLPYFWGRPRTWPQRMHADDRDPLFANFLQAGAARVRIPVAPAFAQAALWYQLTGEIIPGGDVPALDTVDDPDAALYSSYLLELASADELPDINADVAIASDDPLTFLATVPTTLVWLQGDATLPNFE